MWRICRALHFESRRTFVIPSFRQENFMKALLRAAITACVAAIAVTGSASAAQIYLYGTAEEEVAPNVQSPWTLLVTYTPSTTYRADVTAAVFQVTRFGTTYTWNSLESSTQNRIRISSFKNAYDLSIRFQGPSSTPIGSTTGQFQADVDITVGGGAVVALREATEANVNLLTSTGSLVGGKFLVDPDLPFDTDGMLPLDGVPRPVPEPTSVMLLSGLGLVAGRRVMARRRQKAAEKAEAAA
jgi:hypothetical protein